MTPSGRVLGVEAGEDLAGGRVDVADASAEPDGPDAASGSGGGRGAIAGSRRGKRGRAVRPGGWRFRAWLPPPCRSISTGARVMAGTVMLR